MPLTSFTLRASPVGVVDRLKNVSLCAWKETVVISVYRSVVAGVRHVVAFLKKRKVSTRWNG